MRIFGNFREFLKNLRHFEKEFYDLCNKRSIAKRMPNFDVLA